MFLVQGNIYDIAGLKDVRYIFDQQEKLAGVILTMDKRRFDDIKQILDRNYRAVTSQVPFVGNKFVSYRHEGVHIELDAPHLQFDMTVTYMTDILKDNFVRVTERERQESRQRESSRF